MNYGLIITCLLIISCTSTTPIIQKNQDDDSVRFYAKKVNKGKTSKTKHLKGLENAYHAASSFDWYLVDSLQKLEGNAHWPAINQVHRRIKEREDEIAGLLPLTSKDGYVPILTFTSELSDIEMYSRKNAASYLYEHAGTLLDMAKSGNRLIARQAYDVLEDLKKNYFSTWADTDAKMTEALELGTTNFLVETGGSSFYNSNFWNDFYGQGNNINNNRWHHFDRTPLSGRYYHYTLHLNLVYLDPGTESRTETSRTETKEVQDGETVKKDSLGNVVERTPIMVTVSGTITEVTVTKNGSVSVFVTINDYQTGVEVYRENLYNSYQYSESSCSSSGDQRAFSSSVSCSGGIISGPPGDWYVVQDLAFGIRWQLKHFIRRHETNI